MGEPMVWVRRITWTRLTLRTQDVKVAGLKVWKAQQEERPLGYGTYYLCKTAFLLFYYTCMSSGGVKHEH